MELEIDTRKQKLSQADRKEEKLLIANHACIILGLTVKCRTKARRDG